MPMLAIGKFRTIKSVKHSGFTLIEILVVMAIMGILLLQVSYRLGSNLPEKPLADNISQLNQQIKFALDYTTFNHKVLAITLHETGYYFSDYHPNDATVTNAGIAIEATTTWQVFNRVGLSPQYWHYPDAIDEVVLLIEQTPVIIDNLEQEGGGLDMKKTNKQPPHIIVFPDYELSDFSLILLGENTEEVTISAQEFNFLE